MVMSVIVSGDMAEVIPRKARILKMLLPRTLPIAIADCPLRAAITVVASSGSEDGVLSVSNNR